MDTMYAVLNVFFIAFHTALILFNLLGWMWKKTRRANLITLLLTGLSWTVLGIWYGFGYCPCTDWHWQVRRRLGDDDLPNSYMIFLIDTLTGVDMSASFVNSATLLGYLLVLSVSIYVNVRDARHPG